MDRYALAIVSDSFDNSCLHTGAKGFRSPVSVHAVTPEAYAMLSLLCLFFDMVPTA